jgi:cytochrome c oxidase cbb3-type subunit 4
METYSILRQFADSWGLLVMFAFFVSVILWAFRPGARAAQNDSANIIFRNEAEPVPEARATNNKEAAQ